ncbi:MAG: pyrimidine utilization protein D [Ktedonobacteraceae bacterium]
MSEHKGKLEGKWITTASGLSMYSRASIDPVHADAPTVVLVHGLSVSSGYMMPTAVRLAPHYHVYLPDLPGFGKSPKPPHTLNVAELSDALAAWMQVMKLPSATFLGNSMGCQVIVNLALRYPECIHRAILVSPTMDPKARTIHQEAGRLLLDTPCEPLHFLPVLLREYVRAGIPRTIRTLQYAFEDLMEEHLPRVHVPTLVVRGSRDPIVPQDWAEEVDSLLPNSQLVVVQGAGHAVNFNSPDRLVHLVRSFLQEDATQ